MEYSTTKDANHINVMLSGRFTFEDHNKFRTIMDMVRESGCRNLLLDFKNLSYVDSAAVGMLLLLKDVADECSMNITLANANAQVGKILEISNLGQLFAIR